jgi:hypothetical protein
VKFEEAGLLKFGGPQIRRYKIFSKKTLKIQAADLGQSLKFEAAYLTQILKTVPSDYQTIWRHFP